MYFFVLVIIDVSALVQVGAASAIHRFTGGRRFANSSGARDDAASEPAIARVVYSQHRPQPQRLWRRSGCSTLPVLRYCE